jgi:UDP-N-acetylglucosamine transferase subunit ALG13
MQQNKHFLVIPRLKQYGEHVDNHQKEIVKDFNDKGYIIGIENVEQLKDAILKAKEFKPVKYKHNNEKMLKIIQEFIDK